MGAGGDGDSWAELGVKPPCRLWDPTSDSMDLWSYPGSEGCSGAGPTWPGLLGPPDGPVIRCGWPQDMPKGVSLAMLPADSIPTLSHGPSQQGSRQHFIAKSSLCKRCPRCSCHLCQRVSEVEETQAVQLTAGVAHGGSLINLVATTMVFL